MRLWLLKQGPIPAVLLVRRQAALPLSTVLTVVTPTARLPQTNSANQLSVLAPTSAIVTGQSHYCITIKAERRGQDMPVSPPAEACQPAM